MNSLYLRAIRACVKQYPQVVLYLKGRARWVAFAFPSEDVNEWLRSVFPYYLAQLKTYDYYLQQMERLIRSVYQKDISSEFLDLTANLISGQLRQAYEQAWADEGTEGEMPEYLTQSYEQAVMGQYQHVDGLYRDIVSARELEQPLDPLLARAPLWANQWNAAYNEATRLIFTENGEKLAWRKGNTENGCDTCARLDGIVAYASEWDELGVHPQGYPNDKLDCQGGGPGNYCDCTFVPTDQRRSPKAFDTIANIIMSR